ncbi:hypothetical protein [Phaffia rhodozyma]|uniref:Uncharacterized protein n=1 Tax=Phaffia rhodozyma TaxID=264483 RepID=A0A0F7SN89_PHARH|nr:hypothetical protein [Phaffia rhodozyma]
MLAEILGVITGIYISGSVLCTSLFRSKAKSDGPVLFVRYSLQAPNGNSLTGFFLGNVIVKQVLVSRQDISTAR